MWTARGMPSLVATTSAGFSGYAVLLPVSPLWAVHGGADEAGAGLVNGVLLLATVITQLFIPSALRRFGWGPVLSVGLALLGLPSLLHLLSDALAPTLVLSAVRGVGFGVLTVTGSAATAELVEPRRRGAAVGAYGLAIAGPQVFLLPLGAWVADAIGFTAVFVMGAAPLLGVLTTFTLARAIHASSDSDHDTASLDDPSTLHPGHAPTGRVVVALLRPMMLLLGVTLAGGAIITFAPQMIDDPALVAASLACLGVTAALTRWGMGGIADRHGNERFLWPFVLVTVASMGLAALAVEQLSAPLFLLAAALLGCAYGGLQNLTLLVSFASVTRRHYGLASSVWNIGFDLGSGLGSVLVGAIAVRAGFPSALLVTAAIALLTLPLALRRRPARAT